MPNSAGEEWGAFRWVKELETRAGEGRAKDVSGQSFWAPRSHVVKLCGIVLATLDLVRSMDENFDAPTHETEYAVKLKWDRLKEKLR